MSREIKFRCWNSFSNTMHDWEEMVSKNKIHLLAENKPPYLVMQFTGLKDKNGVEVYEGDVVKVDDDGDCYLSDVYFDGGALCISVEHCDFDYTAIGWAIGSQCGIESIEVIGNIHENPELLNE